jgi:hypothetical protein
MEEDHPAQAAWNLFGFMWTLEQIVAGKLPDYMNDIPNLQGKVLDLYKSNPPKVIK